MLRIAIIDDEKQQRKLLKGFLSQYEEAYPDMEIIECASGEEFLDSFCINHTKYDIVFLDIGMKGINGIDVAVRIREQNHRIIIIFVTGILEYVFQAFEVKAFRYLLKPISPDKFNREFLSAIKELFSDKGKRLLINTKERMINIDIDELIYLEGYIRKVTAYTSQGSITFYGKIHDLEISLINYNFVRIYRSIIVNPAYVRFIEQNQVILKNDVALPLSRNRRQEAYRAFSQFLMER